MSTTGEQTLHYCNKYEVFCTGANGHGECNTTACWNRWRRDGVIPWVSLSKPHKEQTKRSE